MEEKKKSVLADILKREKLEKAFGFNREKSKEESQETSSTPPSKEGESASNLEPPPKPTPSKEKTEPAKPINSYDKAVEDLVLDIRFYFLKEGEYAAKFKKLYNDNKSSFEKYGISPRKYLEYCQESFDRYKKARELMPLDPMKPKAYDYVEKSIKELLSMFARKFGN